MIFDSPQMAALRQIYWGLADYEVPEVVFLDRFDDYEGERSFLEELLRTVSLQKQKDWLGRLVNEDADQHIGAWFEMMLYGWLRECFTVKVEPELLENFPDFVVECEDSTLVIEARAFLKTPEEGSKRIKISRIWSALRVITRPFLLTLDIRELGNDIISNNLQEDVERWLDSAPEQLFIYQDRLGNILQLSAQYHPTLIRVGITRSEVAWVNPDVLRAPLRQKSAQHKNIRRAGYPYVIAVYLEPALLSAEEVTEAWIGKPTVVIDVARHEIVQEKIDQSGIQYFGNEIRHKTVSGILVFKADLDKDLKSRYFRCWYVENPYAKVKVDPNNFPAEARFIVVGKDDKNYQMEWRN